MAIMHNTKLATPDSAVMIILFDGSGDIAGCPYKTCLSDPDETLAKSNAVLYFS